MDTQNLGYLSVEKMYQIMESLQKEQKKSAELISELQNQQHKALGLKRAVIALIFFALLLAVANIGTSFAAASLAKETSVDAETQLVVKGTHVRVSTTSRLVEIVMEPIDDDMAANNETLTRHLQEYQASRRLQRICGGASSGVTCGVQGT